jgi:hypothetical protein
MLRNLTKLLSDICYKKAIRARFHIVKLNLEKKTLTVCVFRPGRSQQNAQLIWSFLLVEIRIVGCILVTRELQFKYLILQPSHNATETVALL